MGRSRLKAFESHRFDPTRCRKEVGELRQWLAQHPILDEKRQILPFFQQRRQLSAFVASYAPDFDDYDRIAFEYPLFGDFTRDLVVGDSARNAYCLIEFEDAGPNSLFIQRGKRVRVCSESPGGAAVKSQGRLPLVDRGAPSPPSLPRSPAGATGVTLAPAGLSQGERGAGTLPGAAAPGSGPPPPFGGSDALRNRLRVPDLRSTGRKPRSPLGNVP